MMTTFRELSGEVEQRTCLMCDKPFQSMSRANRRCSGCKKKLREQQSFGHGKWDANSFGDAYYYDVISAIDRSQENMLSCNSLETMK